MQPETNPSPARSSATSEPNGAVEPPIIVSLVDGVATLTLNRPQAMNSLNLETKELLLQTLRAVADDPSARCVVLTGAGPTFCVGQDLKEHQQILAQGDTDALFATVPEHYNPIARLIHDMPKPTIAAVNGIAAGAGASLAWACDLRVLVDTAGFNTSFVGVGLSCDTGASWTLPRLIGTGRALELLYFPRTLGAEEALSLGLANRVVSAAEFPTTVTDLAQRLADGPTLAYAAIRRAVDYSATHKFSKSLGHEAEGMNETGASPAHRAAVDAFLSKRSQTTRNE